MFANLIAGLIALVLLTAPGWWIARRHRLPLPALAGFVGGGVLLLTLVLVLQLAGLSLTRRTLGAAWLIWSLAAWLVVRRSPPGEAPVPNAAAADRLSALERAILLVAVIPILSVIVWRATTHPLFGVDTGFRWGHLAELMWTQGTLSFYPPVTDADYTLYVWPDGIPPLVSSLYFGVYALAGRIARPATSPLVVAQFLLLLAATGALARRFFSIRAAAFAVALLAVTPLAAWATAMGQETGFTALSLVMLMLYLPRDRTEENPAAMIAAGIAISAGALARQYGWAFVLLGVVLAIRRGLSVRGLAWFAAPVLVFVVPWYARNFAATGNPLFNHSLGGLFPINAAHERLMAIYRDAYRFLPQLREQPAVIFENCAAVLVAGLAGAVLFFRRARGLILASLLVIALWFISVRDTAAGLANSLRVLNPALAIGAALGGAACAQILAGRRRVLALIVIAALSADAALRALTLPNNTYRLEPAKWLEVDHAVEAFQDRPVYHELVRRTAGARVLALGPNVYLAKLGLAVEPPWSPGMAFLFDRRIPAADGRARLFASGVRYVLIAKGSLNQTYLEQCPALAEATSAELTPVFDRDNLLLLALTDPRKVNGPR